MGRPAMVLILLRYAIVGAWIQLPLRVSRRGLAGNCHSFARTSTSLAHPPTDLSTHRHPNFLNQVEETVSNVLDQYQSHDTSNKDFVRTLDPEAREAFGVAQILQRRLQSFYRPGVNCPRCWLQAAHCICSRCPPVDISNLPVERIFVVMHHKEICLAVDTAKLILSSFPEQCQLVVAGIGPQYQSSMREMMEVIRGDGKEDKCLLLFPTENARTFAEIITVDDDGQERKTTTESKSAYDLIVIDGTWAQARKIRGRYFDDDNNPSRVQLSESSLESLTAAQSTDLEANGHRQLRRHPIDWRTISTMEATRLLLKDIATETSSSSRADEGSNGGDTPFWEKLLGYQQAANEAALQQLGPPRIKTKNLTL